MREILLLQLLTHKNFCYGYVDSGVPVADSLLNDFVSAFKRIYPQDNVNIDNSHDCMCINPLLTMHLHQHLCKCNVHEGGIITSAIDTWELLLWLCSMWKLFVYHECSSDQSHGEKGWIVNFVHVLLWNIIVKESRMMCITVWK